MTWTPDWNDKQAIIRAFDNELNAFRQAWFFLELAKGKFSTLESISIFGDAPDFNSGESPIDVTSATTPSLYIFPTTDSTLSVVSNNAADTSTGTGARDLIIKGLDINYNEIEETIVLNGLTPVITSNSYLRVNDVRVDNIGTSRENEGFITLTHGVDIIATISPRTGRALQAIYTVPAGKTGYIGTWDISTHAASASAATAKEIIAQLKVAKQNKSWVTIRIGGERSDGGHLGGNETLYEKIEEKSDIRIEVEALSNSSAVASSFELILVS